jgi:pimeloyl-ACP methyl ester carboxylesterase
MRRLGALATLLRWLGPWSKGASIPGGVLRETWTLRQGARCGHRAFVAGDAAPSGSPPEGRRPHTGPSGSPPEGRRPHTGPSGRPRLEAYLYRSGSADREPLGAWLVAPGLHFLGPDDPRLDRFCRVLAEAGFWVLAPFLPGYVDLLVAASAADDLELCARALLARRAERKLSLFSVSFGSWPALEVAARLGDAADGVVTFGGYADFDAAVRFCADGVMREDGREIRLARDPLNLPALFVNLLPFLDVAGETSDLERAFREIAHTTWGTPELKAPGRLEPFARKIVERLPEQHRELFLVGCGVLPGAVDLVESALGRSGDRFGFASPRAAVERLTCPVVVCHGQDDDVIPYGEAHKLYALVSRRVPARLLVTGLYGHTGAEKPKPGDALREARVLLEIAATLAAGGRLREKLRAT